MQGTAFAGSLYAICSLAVWRLARARLPDQASLVIADGAIRYRKPVVGDIIARCQVSPYEMQAFLDAVHAKGKGRLQATVSVAGEKVDAAEFNGTVYARLEPAD